MVWSARMRSDLLAAPRLVCAAALLLVSCTRTLDFDELSSESHTADTGVAPGSLDDAASPTPTATPIDTPTGMNDDPPPTDAGVLSLDGSFSCRTVTPPATFCDDFDTLPLANVWDEVLPFPAAGGTLALDGDDALSPSNALLATIPPGIEAGTYVGLVAGKSFSQVGSRPSRIEIEFDMKVEQIDGTPGRSIVAFQFVLDAPGPDARSNQLGLEVHSNGDQMRTRLHENLLDADGFADLSETHELRSGPPVNRWSHVAFELDIDIDDPSNSNNRAHVRIGPRETFESDAVTLFEGTLRYGLHAGWPRIEVGIPWLNRADETTAWRIRYDNVLVRLGSE